MVFDGVVRAALQQVGDISPFVGLIPVQEVKNPFFFSAPSGASLDHWVQMIVPSFSPLLSDSSWQVIRYLCPLLGALEVYEAQQKPVFDLGPRAFNQSWI